MSAINLPSPSKPQYSLKPVPFFLQGFPKCLVLFQIFFLEVVLEKPITNPDIHLNAEEKKLLIAPLCNLAQALNSKNNMGNLMLHSTAKNIVERNEVRMEDVMETNYATCLPILYKLLWPVLNPVLIEVAKKIVELRDIVDQQMSPGDLIPFTTQPTVGESGPLKFEIQSHIFNDKVQI